MNTDLYPLASPLPGFGRAAFTASRGALATALALSTLGSASAQTWVRSADAYTSQLHSPNYNAIQLNTHAGNVLKVNDEVDFNGSSDFRPWESVAWVSSSGSRVSAAMIGTDEFQQPITTRGMTINNLTLWNVDLDMANVQIHFQAPTANPNAPIALTLNNASLGGGLRTPLLWAPSLFQFSVTGDSQIGGWEGQRSSVTALDIASGATLRIKDCGSVTATTPNEKLFFDALNNTAVVNGGSLVIDNSAVVFGRDPHSQDANQSTMTFLNQATLRITGPNTTPKLETDRLVFQNSTLDLADNTELKARSFLELDHSTATTGDGGRVDAFQVHVKGDSTATLARHTGGGPGIVTSFLNVHDGATFTLAGNGHLAVNGAVYFPSAGAGAIRVTQNAGLLLEGANLNLNSHGSLTTERTATTESSVALVNSSVVLHNTGTLVNNGSLGVDLNSDLNVIGHATIGGTGYLDMDGGLIFAGGVPGEQGKSSLTTGNHLDIGMNAVLTMSLDPTAGTSDRIICGNLLAINPVAELDLQLVNDTTLALGTKFALFDYRGLQTPLGDVSHFYGYENGSTFSLGLNNYQINYRDGDYLTGSSSFITLTTVPEPTTAALLFGGVLLLAVARRIPSAASRSEA